MNLRARNPSLMLKKTDSAFFFEIVAYWSCKKAGYILVSEDCSVNFIYVEPKYRRKGIALALYEEAAIELAKEKKKLYASTIQHDNAIAVWEWLKTNTPSRIGMDNGRMFLSFL